MLKVGGFVPFSATDYPGQFSAVIFCQGCPWSCTYCHNPHLQDFSTGNIEWTKIMEFLRRRQGLLDAVVFSGGEPTMQNSLPEAIAEVKLLGYLIGIHTAAIEPKMFEEVLPLIDWVGLDVKALPETYAGITGRINAGKTVFDALKLVVGSGKNYEVRTTIHNNESAMDLCHLAKILSELGIQNYSIQLARTSDLKPTSADQSILQEQIEQIRPLFKTLALR